MNVIFDRIEIQNFKSVAELQILNFSQLNGINFIYGTNYDNPGSKNGSGKTVIGIDALVFALFGKTLKNTNNKYLPNRVIQNNLESYVKVFFSVDGQKYSSKAYGRFGGKIMGSIGMELFKLNDNEEIIEDLTQSSVQKTKQYIQDNLLECSFELFKSSIIISSSEFMNFYEGMNKQAKRSYIENIFNLNCFGTMFSDIKADINDTKREISSTNNDIIKNTQTLKQLEEKFAAFDNKLDSDLLSMKNSILEKYKSLKNLESNLEKIKQYDINIDQLKRERTEIKSKLDTIQSTTSKISNLMTERQVKIETINHTIKELNDIKDGLCESCAKIMNSRYDYENKIKTISLFKEDIEKFKSQLEQLKEKQVRYNETYLEYSNKILEANDTLHKINSLERDINYIKDDIRRIKNDYDSLKNNTVNPFLELIEKTNKSISTLKEQLFTYTKNCKHLELLKEACSENGVKRLIIKDIIKLLNSLIQKYLNEIGAEFLVYFDETMEFRFLTQNGECEFSSFSAGEKQRIQIATIFAFRDLILNGKINSNIFIIDEMLDANIDSICIENIMNILKRKSAESNQNMFIISHRSELAEDECWDNIIEVIKENSKSIIKIH